MQQTQQPGEHILVFYWVEIHWRVWRCKRKQQGGQAGHLQDICPWCLLGDHCEGFTSGWISHGTEVPGKAVANVEKNYFHHDWLGIIELHNILTIQQSSTQVLLFLRNHFLPCKLLPSPVSKVSAPSQLALHSSAVRTMAKPVQSQTFAMTGPTAPLCLALWYRVPQTCFLWKGWWLIIREKPCTVVITIIPWHPSWTTHSVTDKEDSLLDSEPMPGSLYMKGQSQMRMLVGR